MTTQEVADRYSPLTGFPMTDHWFIGPICRFTPSIQPFVIKQKKLQWKLRTFEKFPWFNLLKCKYTMKERILTAAEQLFWKFGVRSVTMEDIAKQLGISKKTIYQHFTDKENILYQVIQEKVAADMTEMNCMGVETANPIEGLMMVLEMMRKNQHQVSPNLLMDIKRYHPQAFGLFRQHMDQHIMKSILENIQKGILQKLYRSDINPAILARMRVEQIELSFNNDFFPMDQYSMLDVQRELMHHFVRGMLTEQGFTIYNLYVNQHNHANTNYQTDDTGLAAHAVE